MGKRKKKPPDLEKFLPGEKRKYVTYETGAQIYIVGKWTFAEWAKDAGAIYRVKGIVLVNTELVDQYLENFREDYRY